MGMRIAVLVPGEPRFSQEFTDFIGQLPNQHSIDWFFWLWQQSPKGSYPNTQFVAESWQTIPNEQWAREKIESNIKGPNHSVASVMVEDKAQWPAPEVRHKAGETNVERCWGMYSSLYQCDRLRQMKEHYQQFKYDLVIRTRPDIKLDKPVDVDLLLSQVSNNRVVTPKNEIHGYGYRINDMYAVGSSESMTAYTSLANHIIEYHNQGLIFHPETLLAFHLSNNSIENISGDFSVMLRVAGSSETGGYISDFGNWA